MKAWAKKLGTLAAVGTVAPLALAATLYAVDRNGEPGEPAPSGEMAQAAGDGFTLRSVVSSARAVNGRGPVAVPAASDKLSLAAFEVDRLLEPANIVIVNDSPPVGPQFISVPMEVGGGQPFAIFNSAPLGNAARQVATTASGHSVAAMLGGMGMIAGPGSGGTLPPHMLQLLQMANGLGFPGANGGWPPFGGHDMAPEVVPLPPAILAFLSGLAVLAAFRRVRGSAGASTGR